MTGGIAAGAMGMGGAVALTGIGAGAAMGAAVVGGAVGSVLSQGVGIAMGVQDRFSWKNVALGAIGAGVGAGVGGWLNVPGGALSGSGNWATAGRMAVGNVATQGLSIATGLQKSFDWRGVAASAASGYVSAWAGSTLQGMDVGAFGQRLGSGMAGGIVSAEVRGGSVGRALPGIVGDALGATVGNELGESIAAANWQRAGIVAGQGVSYNNTPPSNDFSSVNALMNSAPILEATIDARTSNTTLASLGLDAQGNGPIDRSSDVLTAENWVNDPSKPQVRSDIGSGSNVGSLGTSATATSSADENEMDKMDDSFVNARNRAKDYVDAIGLRLNPAEQTYLTQRLQVFTSSGTSLSQDQVYDLVDDVGSRSGLLTPTQIQTIFPKINSNLANSYAYIFNTHLPDYGIDTPQRQAAFFGQVAQETGGLTSLKENLDYSDPQRLANMFKRVFNGNAAAALSYVHNPVGLEQVAYPDGVGRGVLQITGAANLRSIGSGIGVDLVGNPDLLVSNIGISVQAAAQYWSDRNINAAADRWDITTVTRLVNGSGLVGLNGTAANPGRLQLSNQYLAILGRN